MTGFVSIPLAEEGGERSNTQLAGVAKVLGPRWLQLPALTIGLLGVQVFWSIEMSYGTPYLLSLGLSKSAVATVFLAGPISGLLVQPLIGVLADNSKSRFGRRRPYMFAGTCICVVAMLLLGFTRPFASIFTTAESMANNVLTICLAIFALFSIDFSINAVQAVDRALIVDTLPSSDQADANAWAARMLGVGSVAGYFIGNVDLTTVFSFLGNTELEVLAVLGSFLLIAMHTITALCTKERVVIATKGARKGFLQELKDIWDNVRNLPPVIRQICIIQFFAWIGWFPILFYTTEFIGELHKHVHSSTPQDDPDLNAEATRLGSRALFYSSILSLACNLLLPFFVSEATKSRAALDRNLNGHATRWVMMYQRVKIHLATLWAVSHMVFAVCMAATFFYSTVWGATFFTTITGFSWSITQWAPFSLLAEAILSEDDSDDRDTASIMLADTRHRSRPASPDEERQFLVADPGDEDEGLEAEVRSFRSSASMDESDHEREALRHQQERRGEFMSNASARMSHLEVHGDGEPDWEGDGGKEGGGLAAKAGIILGIHNVFIVMPQFVMTGIASIIFAIFDGAIPKSPDGTSPGNSTATPGELAKDAGLQLRESLSTSAAPNSYAIVFRLGGVASIVAFVLTVRLARELRRRQ
ncbi:MFS general substrate transporter [Fomitopsis serialis]|uniref:MFS general substrate transporter n=1 Tax=Fomitopsis serialis TaxID=139415 RepID=UPI002008DF58|nr:MFS general substrate transporter [Neoantrodia serialis]KAH9930693.1 MFS general substrate transporter [Neoantrodia serialis]